MKKITLRIDGMACSMCESHVNDAIRHSLNVRKVSSSAKKGETTVISEEVIPESRFIEAIAPTGYRLLGYECTEYEEKKGFLSRLFSK